MHTGRRGRKMESTGLAVRKVGQSSREWHRRAAAPGLCQGDRHRVASKTEHLRGMVTYSPLFAT